MECLPLGLEQEFKRHHVEQEFIHGCSQVVRLAFDLSKQRARLRDQVGAAGVDQPLKLTKAVQI